MPETVTDVPVLSSDFLEKVIADEARAQISKVLGDNFAPLTKDGKWTPKQFAYSEDQRLAYFTKLWLDNGYENPQEAEFLPHDSKDQDKIRVNEYIQAIDESAKGVKEAGVLQDVMYPDDSPLMLRKVVTLVVRDAAEPLLIGTQLMRMIRYTGETITFPAMGAIDAEDIPPGGEYPEKHMEMSGVVSAKIGKSGVKIRFTDEVLRYSMFDVMSLHIQAAGRAMARLKETKIWALINDEGTASFDNDDPGSAINGSTTGRNFAGAKNGTFMLNDLFTMFADLMNAGFVPDTLCMNPMGWLIFARNPEMRALAYQIGNGSALWQRPSGAPGLAPSFGGLYKSGGNTPSANPSAQNNATLNTPPPGFFPVPFAIVVSPFVAWDSSALTTTIIMADRNMMGYLVQDEDLMSEEWDDPARDIVAMKFRERYALALDNEGRAVVTAKGVSTSQGYDHEANARWQAGTGALPTGNP